MKWLLSLSLVFCLSAAKAQNLGDAYVWLKDSYKKIPMKSGMPYYDTTIKQSAALSSARLFENANFCFETVLGTPAMEVEEGKVLTADGSYMLYTNEKRDEEHAYKVHYKVDIRFKGGKYDIVMHDFNIYFLENKVEFPLKYKAARNEDGKSNQFMAIFHTLNQRQIKKAFETMSLDMLPANATASN